MSYYSTFDMFHVGVRDRNIMDHASFYFSCWRTCYLNGIDNTHSIWIMVSIKTLDECERFKEKNDCLIISQKKFKYWWIYYRGLCSDLVYVVLFPQLLMVVHYKNWVNTYGSFTAYFIGLFLRLGGGEPLISLPALIKYPLYDENLGQMFPIRTFAMIISLTTLIAISQLTRYVILS